MVSSFLLLFTYPLINILKAVKSSAKPSVAIESKTPLALFISPSAQYILIIDLNNIFSDHVTEQACCFITLA
ncbi:hypothetical protein V6N11_083048 [Hibiscus sabdariffa]|uniref:Uncharacterized protein n=1 Tax=Hibiscus sabdariffa TaxID=183260 RepID=A0ABR2QKN9_9ROSI